MIERIYKTTCDGCGNIVPEDHLYKIVLIDNGGGQYHFHDYNCIGKWSKEKQKQLDKDLELAEAHKELHAALDAKATEINKDDFMTEQSRKFGLEVGAPLEYMDLKQTQEALQEVTNG